MSSNGGGTNTNTSHGSGGSGGGGNGNGGIYLKVDGSTPLTGIWTTGNYGITLGSGTLVAADLTATSLVALNSDLTLSAGLVNRSINITPSGTGTVKVAAGKTLKVDTINESTTNATTVTIANTGTSTDAAAVAISSTSGGVTITAAANKNVAIATSGTGRLTNNSVAVPTISSTDSLTNKTLASSTNYIRPSYSYRRVDNTLGAILNQNINTTIVFDSIMLDVGVFSSEMTITAHKFINSSGALRSWTVLFTFFTSGIVAGTIEQYDTSNTLVNTWIGTLSPVTNANGQTSAKALMDIGDYLVFKIFTTSVSPYLYSGGSAVRTNVTFTDHGLPS